MIDIEDELFSLVSTSLRSAFDDIFVTNEYVSQPPRFPAVSIIEMSNTVVMRTQDSGSMENHADLMYQVDVYSNRQIGKRLQAKTIMGMVDTLFAASGFTRTFMNPMQNMNEPSIYRITARYQAVAGADNKIYRR